MLENGRANPRLTRVTRITYWFYIIHKCTLNERAPTLGSVVVRLRAVGATRLQPSVGTRHGKHDDRRIDNVTRIMYEYGII
jgi:hypothetical protein